MNKALFFIGLAVAATFAACNQITQSVDDTLHGSPRQSREHLYQSSKPTAPGDFLTNAGALTRAEAALRNLPELKGKKINIYNDLHLYDDGRIMIQIQDPDTLQNINEYEYSREKEWGAKRPVNISANELTNLNSTTIPLDSVRFAGIAKMAGIFADSARHAASKSTLTHIYYVNMVNAWYCNDIAGSRASYQIYFNRDGTVKEYRRL